MNEFLISVSSNSKPKINIRKVKSILEETFQAVTFASVLKTEPVGEGYPASFWNSAAKLQSELSAEDFNLELKKIELQLGRTEELKKLKIVPIDLDIIIVNNEIVHKDYNRFPFLRQLISEIR